MKCSICKTPIQKPDGCATGYGLNNAGEKVCYDCCGKQDISDLTALQIGARFILYLDESSSPPTVTNWPGSLKILCWTKKGRHNIAGKRLDVWFSVNPDTLSINDLHFSPPSEKQMFFHGVNYGHDSQICYVRRIKPPQK